MRPRQLLLPIATACYLAFVGWVTLGPQPLDSAGSGLLRQVIQFLNGYEFLRWVSYDLVEFVANILLFVPIGVLFSLLLGRRRWWLAGLLGVALSVSIEFSQLFLRHRVSDLRDILSNSLGAAIGVALVLAALAWASSRAGRTAAGSRAVD
jgi:glycopeptide antibiotics resistance protein